MIRLLKISATFLILLLLVFPVIFRSTLKRHYQGKIFETGSAPQQEAAVVFGAAVYRNGWLSSVLRDRMDTAIDLYRSGTVEKLLLSGHRSSDGYDEPGAMMAYASANGVALEDIITDAAGHRTYDTCYRAKNVFKLKSAVLVSQDFHLPRALFLCSRLGLPSVGASADQRTYLGARWYEIREIAASSLALIDVARGLEPALLEAPMPIR